MASPCAKGISSNCVEIQTTTTLDFKSQSELNDYVYNLLQTIQSDIDTAGLSLDGTGLSNLNSLIDVVQYLINQVKLLNSNTVSIPEATTSVDLKCLSSACNTSTLTQEAYNQIIVNAFCNLQNEVRSLKSKITL